MKKNLDSYIDEIGSLPTAPGVLVKLIAIFQNPDRDVDEVVALIVQDPSLTAGVLRHANSAFSTPDEPIVDVFDAITWVGFSQVYQAVLAKLASQTLQLPKGACGIDLDELWRHSAVTGVCAGAIAKRIGENESMAFTAGLLHDIGKVVFALAEGAAYLDLMQKAGGHGTALSEAEEITFGFSHADVGSQLLTRWGLPQNVFKPVREHHQSTWSEPFDKLSAVVSVANLMAHAAESNSQNGHYESKEAVAAMRAILLNAEDISGLFKSTEKEIARMAGAMSAAAR